MISRSWNKLIKSLQNKKYRKIHQLFLVEGAKSVQELLESDYQATMLFSTEDFIREHIRLIQKQSLPYQVIAPDELAGLGTFQTNNACLAVVRTKPNVPLQVQTGEYGLVLDDIKDPGNLGTILRIADWYGINKIICSETTADVYNPKVISASMGSFTRVQTYYCNLREYLSAISFPVYGAFLDGQPVHDIPFAATGLIVMGNESQGIHPELVPFIHQRIHIPRYGGAESLNVGIATAIICDNWRRGERAEKGKSETGDWKNDAE
jgi:RNA methyltransferase, TrmH family